MNSQKSIGYSPVILLSFKGFVKRQPYSMARLIQKATTKKQIGAAIALGMVLLLLALAPFSTALAIHHDFAAADHDGHEHSDTDVCQWVQYHTSGSLDLGGPILSVWQAVGQYEVPAQSILLSAEFSSVGPSRAPPRT